MKIVYRFEPCMGIYRVVAGEHLQIGRLIQDFES